MLKDGCGTAHRRAHQRGSPAGRERRSHCIPWTHAEEVNAELLSFLGGKAGKSEKEVAWAIGTSGTRDSLRGIFGCLNG